MRVLLFSNDVMPFGNLPTSGGGLRAWQLMQGLQHHGIEVIASMPAFTYLIQKHFADVPAAQRENLWYFETQDQIYKRVKPDAVIFTSNWDHYALSKKPDVPLIIDLHGSRLIENAMWGSPINPEQKVKTFATADCLLCAGLRQRRYFSGWLVQSGRVPEDEHFIRYIPISLSPNQPEHIYGDDEFPKIVSGGGWFPWQNQSNAIFAACHEVASRNAGRLDIFGTPHAQQGGTPEEIKIRELFERVQQISNETSRVKVHGYVGRNDLIELYRRSDVALEAMHYNLERELAFTTRTIEYLWCGLPVLYNNFGEIAEHIAEYDAGWTVNPADDNEIKRAVEEMFSSREVLRRKSENATRLVRDRFSWDKTITPLLDFLKNPVRSPYRPPVLGTYFSRPSYMMPGGVGREVPLPLDGSAFSTRFYVPSERLGIVEVPLSFADEEARNEIQGIETRVFDARGKLLCRRTYRASDVPAYGPLEVKLPRYREPRGGKELRFEVCFQLKSGLRPNRSPLTVGTLEEASFPLIPENVSSLGGISGGPGKVSKVLALSFVQAHPNQLRHFGVLAMRAWQMLRRGEWQRVVAALRKRTPRVVLKVLDLLHA